MRVRAALFVAAAALTVSGCVTPHPGASPSPAGETIGLGMGPCFGFCPVYDLVVSPAGVVRFTGVRHTRLLGERGRDAGAAAYREAAASLARFRPEAPGEARFECPVAIADTPSARITWRGADSERTLDYQFGCPSDAGRALERAVRALPDLLGAAPWARQVTRPDTPRG